MTTSFTVNLADLTHILLQIKIAELHAAGGDLATIIGPDAALLPFGLRTVDGSYNHLLPGHELDGAADQLFPRLLPASFRLETDGDSYTIVRADVAGAPPGGVTVTNNNYDPTIAGSHSVADADMRIISNLIVDATLNNPAALQAALYAALIPSGTNDLNAAQGAQLTAAKIAITALHDTFKAASTLSVEAQRTETAYISTVADATTAGAQEATASTKLAELVVGVSDGIIDPADLASAAAALAAANAAVAAQQAVIKTLQFEADVAPGISSADAELAAAKVLLAELHAVASAVQAIATALAGGTIDTTAIDAAAASALTAAADAGTNLATLTTDELAATGASNAADVAMNAAIVALNTEVQNDGLEISSDGSITIRNRSPDVGLSPGFNGWMTFFGQFFDHGLDLVTKGNNGTIYIPLQADDSLYDKGQDGLVGDQQVRDADGNLVFLADGITPVMHNDDGYGADGILGTLDDRPNFMALTRATTFIDPVTGLKTETQNTTTPFVDQNQTYTSISSHQVFLREYKLDASGHAISTGHMLDGDVTKGALKGSIANWGEVKAQAQTMLGLTLGDYDVNDVPKLLADAYGKFIPGAHGFAQVYVNVSLVPTAGGPAIPAGTVLVEGIAGGLDLAHIPLPALDANGIPFPVAPFGFTYQLSTVGTGHAFLNDIAHHAAPVLVDLDHNPLTPKTQQIADLDIQDVNRDGVINAIDIAADNHDVNRDGVVDARDLIADDGAANTYDNEMLDAHFLTGDGRGNENIGLTTVHTIFHAEHNRLVEDNKDTIIASGDLATVNEWLLKDSAGPPVNQITQGQLDAIINNTDPAAKALAIDALNWDGERLFQAGRFVTEMQYQHLVFEEFARKVQPTVNPFVFTNSPTLDPSIVAEFAHVVYRFGHSMLSDTVDRLGNDLNPLTGDPQLGLIQAFLNPQAFTASGAITSTASEAAGAIIRGMTRQVGGEIDEFVVQAVRDNLVGLPLDLPALNMARARDTGVPTFNHAREQFYATTGNAALTPYTSWLDFGQHIKNPISIINFIAAYGTHDLITGATTAADKRAAAEHIVLGAVGDTAVQTADFQAFLNGTGSYGLGHANSIDDRGGLDGVDLWIGGLAESKMEFGGMLGSTFNFVFEAQLENLQNGDRLYYLSRTQGMNLLNQLEPNTFSDLVMRNTSLGDLHSTHVNGTLFDTADAILELDTLVAQEDYNGAAAGKDVVWTDGLFHLTTKTERTNGTADVNGDGQIDGNILKFHGGEHVVLGGTEGNDKLYGDRGIDTLWGDGGDDYLNGGSEADQVFGGDGDDIIEDFFGDGDFLRGNLGNDVINDSHGVGDILFGDRGNDFVMGGSDPLEIFAGEGDDFVLGGAGADGLLGNEGSDWIEGGEGLDTLSGENSDLFFNSPIIGHDVLDGQGNDTDYDGESGDDIMVQGAGIQRNNGMLGFDWAIQKGDAADGNIDLGISRFLTQTALTLRDRNDSVEAASGWKHNDTLLGTNVPTGAAGLGGLGIVGAPPTDSMLLSQNVDLIRGLEDFIKLAPGGVLGQSAATVAAMAVPGAHFADLAADTTVFNPQNGGDILVGGAGSDLIFGKAGNDLIDGDRWLNVRIEVHANRDGTGAVLRSVDSLNEIKADMLAGRINPGQLKIVRELITDGATAADTDVAMYAGRLADFSIVRNANGTMTITDNVVAPILGADGIRIPLIDNEGIDTLSNVEIARFTTYDAAGIPNGFRDVSLVAPSGSVGITGTQNVLTADRTSIIDANGLPGAGGFRYQWQSSTDGLGAWANVGGNTNNPNFTVPVGSTDFYRVVVSYTDIAGIAETMTSQITARVGSNTNGATVEIIDGTGDPNLLNGRAGNDVLNGLGGNDVLNAGTGADTLNGGDGDDTLASAVDTVRDELHGDAGSDTADYSAYTTSLNVTLNGATAAVVGGSGVGVLNSDTIVDIENFIGGSAADTITGDAGANVITGGDGADILSGAAGNDTFRYTTGDGADTVNGGADTDTLAVSGTAGANSLNVVFNGTSITQVGGGTVTNVEVFTANLGAGTDTLNYDPPGAAITTADVTVNLATGTASGFASISNIENVTGGSGNDVFTGSSANNNFTGGLGTDRVNFTGTVLNHTITSAGGNVTVANAADGTDTLSTIEQVQFGTSLYNVQLGTNLGTNINGSATGDLILGLGGNDTIAAGLGDDAVVWSVGDGRDTVDGGLGGTDAFMVNGSNAAEAFIVYARADAIAAGVAVVSANTDIIITRNGTTVAELDEIEEIVINTGGGADTVTVIGDFSPTNLSFNTITVNDEGGATNVDLTHLSSAHHVAFFTSGTNDTIAGARPQDQVINDGTVTPGTGPGSGGVFDITAADLAGLKAIVTGVSPTGETEGVLGIRELSGNNNNVSHPGYGASDTPFIRITDAHYGAYDPAVHNMALNPLFDGLDPRNISNVISAQEADLAKNASNGNIFFMAFGQYFDHGLDFLPKGGNGKVVIGGVDVPGPPSNNPADLNRGSVVAGTENGVPQHVNKTSTFADQNQAYGSAALVGQFLREGDGHGGLGAHLLAGHPDPSNTAFNLLPTLRELILQHWNNNTVFHDGSLSGGEVHFRDYYAGLVDANGAIDSSMVAGMSNNFMASGQPLLLDTNPYINLLDHYIAGDGRANENVSLTAMHTIWSRNHNFHVENLLTHGFQGTAEELFQTAKVLNEGEYQRVVFTEFADELIGGIQGSGSHGHSGYDASADPGISEEFASAVYRVGHSLISDKLTVVGADGQLHQIALVDAFLNPTNDASAFTAPLPPGYVPQPGFEQLGANAIIAGTITQQAEEVDFNVVDAVRNNLVRIGADLAAFNIARGRDVGIGSLNEVRAELKASTNAYVSEAVGFAGNLDPYASWDDFQQRNNLSDTVINQFKQAYPDLVLAQSDIAAFMAANPGLALGGPNNDTVKGIDRVDLWVGGLAESHINGGMVGQTFWVVLHEQFDRLQEADRFYYTDRLENLPVYQNIIDDQTFGAIIARNTGLTGLPENVFEATGNGAVLPPLNSAPVIVTNGGGADATVSILEHTTYVTSVHATDLDGNALTYSISGGADKDRFVIGATGELNFIVAPQYGSPSDVGANNVYDVVVKVSDGLSDDTQALAVKVDYIDHAATGGVHITGHTAGAASASLTAMNDIADPDAKSHVVQYQWQHQQSDGTWVDIGGANASMLSGRQGEVLRVSSSYDDAAGHHVFASDETAFVGTSGGNTMLGTEKNDIMLGLDGNDVLLGMGGRDVMEGGSGRDRIYGGGGDDIATGGRGNDAIDGGEGNDSLAGNSGRDRLDGGNGDDILNGGGGNDRLFVGSGNDTIVLTRNFGNDVAVGFDSDPAGGQDHIDLRGLGIHTADQFNHAVTIEQVGHDTLVTIGHDGTLKLIGVNAHSIHVSDFQLS